MMNIVILDAFTVNPGDLSWDGLKELGNVTIYERTAPDEVVDRCRQADIVLTNKVVMSADILSQLDNLKYIGVLATGYNVVDLDAATERGIVVTNIPAYSTMSVAQMVWAHILNITNRVGHYAESNKDGKWTNHKDFCYLDFTHNELAGKKMGIVGLGNTGMATARIAIAFGMDVMAFTSKTDLPDGIRKASMDEVFSTCDIISLHCPLTPTTRNLVDKMRLEQMKPSAILINTSRGPVVNEHNVAEALNNNRIAAFGADVISTEPAREDNPLLKAKNCFLTPHIAWATIEARKRLIDICTDNVAAFLKGEELNKVN